MTRKALPKPSQELLSAAKLVGLRQEKRFLFTYKGHEINLSECKADKPIHVLNCVAEQLAEKLTEGYNDCVKSLFGEP